MRETVHGSWQRQDLRPEHPALIPAFHQKQRGNISDDPTERLGQGLAADYLGNRCCWGLGGGGGETREKVEGSLSKSSWLFPLQKVWGSDHTCGQAEQACGVSRGAPVPEVMEFPLRRVSPSERGLL